MAPDEFCSKIIDGSGGFKAHEDIEFTIYSNRDVAIAEWVIRCLANPSCDGSKEVLDSIMEHREQGARMYDVFTPEGLHETVSKLAAVSTEKVHAELGTQQH